MSAGNVRKMITGVLLFALAGLGMLRMFAEIEPGTTLAAGDPALLVASDGRAYVRDEVRQAATNASGLIAVMTEQAAYVWSSRDNTWYAINLSGQPVEMILSSQTVGVLTTDRAYAWNEQTSDWIWTFVSGKPIKITGSNGHLGVVTDREAYAWNQNTQTWHRTFISGQARQLAGQDEYFRQTGYYIYK